MWRGYEDFVDELAARFPAERRGIEAFYGEAWRVFNALNALELKSLEEPRYLLGGALAPPWDTPSMRARFFWCCVFAALPAGRVGWPYRGVSPGMHSGLLLCHIFASAHMVCVHYLMCRRSPTERACERRKRGRGPALSRYAPD